jgi:hypothetical protein
MHYDLTDFAHMAEVGMALLWPTAFVGGGWLLHTLLSALSI